MASTTANNVVIVGGGAGGLELACKLGRKFGRDRVTLVDHQRSHIWKPSLHEVAAGTLDVGQEALSYSMLAHDNQFSFVHASLAGIDLDKKEIVLAPASAEPGAETWQRPRIGYARLCIAIGSTSNHFNTEGAAENTLSLNSPQDAEAFRKALLQKMASVESRKTGEGRHALDIVIIGGGATGVELAAELREACNMYVNYSFKRLDPVTDIRITLLEGAPRILAPLPERVSSKAAQLLSERNVTVVPNCRVQRITSDEVIDASGNRYRSDLCVWAAGIKAPSILGELGLSTNRSGQIIVNGCLRAEGVEDIYALGDCAACVSADGKQVPARAQAAHQQAGYLYKEFSRQMRGRAASGQAYAYRDYGSLVSLGTQTSVGSLMGSLRGVSWFVEGAFARMLYVSLHLLHHKVVLGWFRTGGLAIARALIRRTTTYVKLH